MLVLENKQPWSIRKASHYFVIALFRIPSNSKFNSSYIVKTKAREREQERKQEREKDRDLSTLIGFLSLYHINTIDILIPFCY